MHIVDTNLKARELLIERLGQDLKGPISKYETLFDEYAQDAYVTGKLYPQRHYEQEQDESLSGETGGVDESVPDEVKQSNNFNPSSMGLSFCVKSDSDIPEIIIKINCAQYMPAKYCKLRKENNPLDNNSSKDDAKEEICWNRRPFSQTIIARLDKDEGIIATNINHLKLYYRLVKINSDKHFNVSISLYNNSTSTDTETKEKKTKKEIQEYLIFQSKITCYVKNGNFIPLPTLQLSKDDDTQSNNLIYRDIKLFVNGRTCSAIYNKEKECVETKWIVEKNIKKMDSDGDPIFSNFLKQKKYNGFDVQTLASFNKKKVKEMLNCLTEAYEAWIKSESEKTLKIAEKYKHQAQKNFLNCNQSLKRISEGIEFICSDEKAFIAFSLANEVMLEQFNWSNPDKKMSWRPFQIGYFLLSCISTVQDDHPDNDVFDLLWFPTGGGKTEAYLLLSCFLIFYNRLQKKNDIDYAGVNIIMRYTLRTVTLDQFQRVSKVIIASELIRKKYTKYDLGDHEISVGLWVGQESTPNKTSDAVENINEDFSSPKQLIDCPVCNNTLRWSSKDKKTGIKIKNENEKKTKLKNAIEELKVTSSCENKNCKASIFDELPIYTYDEIIYDRRPTVLIGTSDKFAQVVRLSNTIIDTIFGDKNVRAPSLIIQDELHLISGPLGTVSSLYEFIIDELCNRFWKKPKIIGSTATIRRAKEQVKSLFNRNSFQFPPPALDFDNSCFSKIKDDDPGRKYVGISTAGASPKYMLQLLSASILQSSNDERIKKENNVIDTYYTLVTYFNSMRELGGSMIMFQDDVPKSMNILAEKRFSKNCNSEIKRSENLNLPPTELTGSRQYTEIRDSLRSLKNNKYLAGNEKNKECIDIVCATNMISVGVDIERLGLMVVNGQPKTMSEYIQSTSRIGRAGPGLILTIYNANKNRDKSHFETFENWHSALYKDIEATSVTPLSPRAIEKVMMPIIACLSKNLLPNFSISLNEKLIQDINSKIIPLILQRVEDIVGDESDKDQEKQKIKTYIDEEIMKPWKKRSGNLENFWNDSKPNKSLLISAEKAAASNAIFGRNDNTFASPNSMRDVEPETEFKLFNN